MKNAAIFLCGIVIGSAALLLLLTILASRFTQPTPHLKPPQSITVFLYPWSGYEAETKRAVRIPKEKQAEVFRRLVPWTFFKDVNEFQWPLVAEAVVTHADRTETRVLVREGGANPALVSLDGVNYFFAKNEEDVYWGANELVRLVADIDRQQQTAERTQPTAEPRHEPK